MLNENMFIASLYSTFIAVQPDLLILSTVAMARVSVRQQGSRSEAVGHCRLKKPRDSVPQGPTAVVQGSRRLPLLYVSLEQPDPTPAWLLLAFLTSAARPCLMPKLYFVAFVVLAGDAQPSQF